MKYSPNYTNKTLVPLLLTFMALFISGCAEDKSTIGPTVETLKPIVKNRPLNDTGVRFSITDKNLQQPKMIPKKDSDGNILSVNGRFVDSKGKRYDGFEQVLDSDKNPIISNGKAVTRPVFLVDENNNFVFEAVAMTQAERTNSDGNIEPIFTALPDIYASDPNEFSDQNNTFPLSSLPGTFSGQDANTGKDVEISIANSDGKVGFNFTKLDKDSGTPLQDDASEFGCVSDNVTGLTWENKVDKRLASLSDYHKLHQTDARHTWYDPNASTNGGNPGQPMSETRCASIKNDTFNFIKAVNEEKLCNFSDWRIPTTEELRSIVDYGVKKGSSANPMADKVYFPFIATQLHRWTAQTNPAINDRAYGFHFHEGRMQGHPKFCDPDTSENRYHNSTILVRGIY